MWQTPESACNLLIASARREIVLAFELTPTGELHSGILRAALRLQEVHGLLFRRGVRSTTLFRLEDRGEFHSTELVANGSSLEGVQLNYVPTKSENFRSWRSWSESEIQRGFAAFGVRFDRVLRTSDMYADGNFQELLRVALLRRGEVLRVLGEFQKSPPAFFRPSCDSCHRTNSTTVFNLDAAGQGVYRCSACGFSSHFSIFVNEGRLSFKLETALLWKWAGVSMPFYGANHAEAFRCSARLFKMLWSEQTPIAYFVNLTIGDDGRVVSKRRGNFSPIADLSLASRIRLIERLTKTSDRVILSSKKLGLTREI